MISGLWITPIASPDAIRSTEVSLAVSAWAVTAEAVCAAALTENIKKTLKVSNKIELSVFWLLDINLARSGALLL